LTCTAGTWTGLPTSYAYQWARNGANISGATSATYTLQSADVGDSVACTVTATSGSGSASATSASTATITTATPPVLSVPPAGAWTAPVVGATLPAGNGTWLNLPTGYTYQWGHGSSPGVAGTNITGATGSTYTVQSSDVGFYVYCTVTATNGAGSASAHAWGTVVTAVATGSNMPLKIASVSGRYQLQTAGGVPFIVKGVTEWSIADSGDDAAPNSYFAATEWADLATVVATEQSYGVNLVRVRLEASYYNGLSGSAQTAYVNQVVTRLADAKTQGAVLMLCMWDSYDQAGGFATNYASIYALMEAVSAATSNDPWLIWEPCNEPNDNSTGTFTWALWQTAMKGIINCLRTTCGYTGVIVIDPLNWANSGAHGLGFSDTDYTAIETYSAGLNGGTHNIAFAVHQYYYPSWSALTQGSTGGWSTSQFTGTVLGGTTTHCILASEVGFDNNPPSGSSVHDAELRGCLRVHSGLG
jgi:hypothetical protein